MLPHNSDIKERIIEEMADLPKDTLAEVLHFVERLKVRQLHQRLGTAIASESVLATDWLTPEEDRAWQDL